MSDVELVVLGALIAGVFGILAGLISYWLDGLRRQ